MSLSEQVPASIPSAPSYELARLYVLLERVSGDDAQIVREAIRHMSELEHQVARDDELWRGITIRSVEEPPPFGRGIAGQPIVKPVK